MSERSYDIPGSVGELFAAGAAQYEIRDHEQAGDNVFALQLFLDLVNVPDGMVEEDSGTQAILFDGTIRLAIDSGGLGDFHLHGYDVSVVEDESATPTARGG